MSFLLDTNVVSEWTRARPDLGVIAWLAEADEDRVFLSVITLAELRHGVDRLAHGARRDRLSAWLEETLPARFEQRLLPVDAETAHAWGRLMARGQAMGRTPATMDAFIAATALRHELAVVTRNADDFVPLGVQVINPWDQGRRAPSAGA
ncbi:MAG: type II toxin-antitoxin system VapC family toxin [Rhodospirillales bacterium]|nr:type II toxin-antitoxin system VapC family toxin [Rhodospirillales bacterium]